MLLAPDATETEIADTVAATLAKVAPLDAWLKAEPGVCVIEQHLTAEAATLGWTTLGLTEEAGGSGLSIIEEVLVLREAGRGLAPVTIAASMLAAHALVATSENPSVTAGWAIEAGAHTWIAGGASATHAVRLTLQGVQCYLIPQGATSAIRPLDAASTLVRVATGDLQPVRESAEAERGLLYVAAQQAGVAERLVLESAAYAQLREQFGRKIGSFQAVRHRCADMAVRAERAKAQLYLAAVTLRDAAPDAAFQALAALHLAHDAAFENAKANILNHGAIGVTAEHTAHLFLKRALLWRSITPARHAILDALSAAPPARFI